MKAMPALDSTTGFMGRHGRGQQMGHRQIEFRSRKNHLVVVGGRTAGTQSPPYAPELAAQLQVLVSSFESPGKHIQTGFCGHCGSPHPLQPLAADSSPGISNLWRNPAASHHLHRGAQPHSPGLCSKKSLSPNSDPTLPPGACERVSTDPDAHAYLPKGDRKGEEEALEGTCWRRELKEPGCLMALSVPIRRAIALQAVLSVFICLSSCLAPSSHVSVSQSSHAPRLEPAVQRQTQPASFSGGQACTRENPAKAAPGPHSTSQFAFLQPTHVSNYIPACSQRSLVAGPPFVLHSDIVG